MGGRPGAPPLPYLRAGGGGGADRARGGAGHPGAGPVGPGGHLRGSPGPTPAPRCPAQSGGPPQGRAVFRRVNVGAILLQNKAHNLGLNCHHHVNPLKKISKHLPFRSAQRPPSQAKGACSSNLSALPFSPLKRPCSTSTTPSPATAPTSWKPPLISPRPRSPLRSPPPHPPGRGRFPGGGRVLLKCPAVATLRAKSRAGTAKVCGVCGWEKPRCVPAWAGGGLWRSHWNLLEGRPRKNPRCLCPTTQSPPDGPEPCLTRCLRPTQKEALRSWRFRCAVSP